MRIRGILALAAILAFSAGLALADEMPFALTTTGSFSDLSDRANLSFTGSSAGGTTVSGVAAPLALGTFTLGSLPTQNPAVPFSQTTFSLVVDFTVPVAIAGGQSSVFSATLNGQVNRNNGSVSVNFGSPRTFTFSNPQGSGSFSFAVHDVAAFDAPGSQSLVGSISAANFTPAGAAVDPAGAVPEPGTVLLLLSGALGVFATRKRLARS